MVVTFCRDCGGMADVGFQRQVGMPFDGFGLPDELWLLSGTVADFVRGEILPIEEDLPADAREIPPSRLGRLQEKARQAGLWCFEAPQRYGGLACPRLSRWLSPSRRPSTVSRSRFPARARSG